MRQAVQDRPEAGLQEGFGYLLARHDHFQSLLGLLDCKLVGAGQLLEEQLDDAVPQFAQLSFVPATIEFELRSFQISRV